MTPMHREKQYSCTTNKYTCDANDKTFVVAAWIKRHDTLNQELTADLTLYLESPLFCRLDQLTFLSSARYLLGG